jgi:citrate synthase
MASSDAQDSYWTTSVSEITPESVFVRGYPLEQLIGQSFTTATYLLVKGELPTPQQARVLDALLTGVLDYGLEKAGTAAARYVVSSNPSVQAGMATAVLAAGDFGLATENSARFIDETHRRWLAAERPPIEEFAAQVVQDARASKFRIPGFGHPVFKKIDPRSAVLRDVAVAEGLWNEPAQLYEAVHAAFVAQPGRADFPINDVGMLAAISVAMGFTPEESTALVVMGTLPGVIAHLSEERASGRVGRIIPPHDVTYNVARRDLADDLESTGWTAAR